MNYRKLRIAWTVAWGVVCLLLIMLWVRSYSYLDTILDTMGSPPNVVTSWRGHLFVGGHARVMHFSDRDEFNPIKLRSVLGVYVLSTVDNGNITYQGDPSLPIAAILLLAVFATGVPWLPWRFSLRTLLIGMTVAAIGLGWIVYLARG